MTRIIILLACFSVTAALSQLIQHLSPSPSLFICLDLSLHTHTHPHSHTLESSKTHTHCLPLTHTRYSHQCWPWLYWAVIWSFLAVTGCQPSFLFKPLPRSKVENCLSAMKPWYHTTIRLLRSILCSLAYEGLLKLLAQTRRKVTVKLRLKTNTQTKQTWLKSFHQWTMKLHPHQCHLL